MKEIPFLGLTFDNVSMGELMDEIHTTITGQGFCRIFTPNVALLMWSRSDEALQDIYQRSEILTVDGYAIYYAMKILGLPIKDTLSPSVFYDPLLEQATRHSYRIFLLGAKEEIVNRNVEVLGAEYPGINIVGSHHGYFDVGNPPEALLEEIRTCQVDLLLVGMSTPQKELFIDNYSRDLGVRVSIGVGGMFDIKAGAAKYAPKIVRVLALEWLYRLVQEPRRLWKRYLVTNTQFLALFALEFLRIRIVAPVANLFRRSTPS